MQKMMGLVRRCIDDYQMIDEADKLAVGVSGGKDSLTLLVLLAGLQKFYPKRFTLEAITIDMGLDGMDFSGVQELCDSLQVPGSPGLVFGGLPQKRRSAVADEPVSAYGTPRRNRPL